MGITQEELGEIVGISQAAISKILLGDTKKSRFLIGIAMALGVNPHWLETGEGDKAGLVSDDIYKLSLDVDALEWVVGMIDKHMDWGAKTAKQRAKMICLLYDLYNIDSSGEDHVRVIMKQQ